ncbi:hypothetical protein ACFVSX_32335 [Streptomyces rubiginosohelvolus]|uniref:hypothetical protein n=1 Tax=Streptomyces rubiginosohelvolus TaxID=67362 RepID=UPI0036DAA7EA
MTEKTPAELREQRARLIASTGLTETVLRERAEAFQLYPEHHDIWATVEGIDYLLGEGDHAATAPAQAEETLRTLAQMFEGLQRLIATSSRDWGEYRVDAWLWAVLLGWDCEEDVHGETCVHGTMEEMQQAHGWDDAAVAKARRYRAAVRAAEAFTEEAGQ